MMLNNLFLIQQPTLDTGLETCSRCMHQYDYDHLPFIICPDEHIVCGICSREITHCPKCQGQLLAHHQSVTKLIKTINNLRHKAQSLMEGDLFPLNDQKKSFDIILAVNKSVFMVITPAELLQVICKLIPHPRHLRVAKISIYAVLYSIDDSSFQYALVTDQNQLRNFLLTQTQNKRVKCDKPLKGLHLVLRALNEYAKKACRRFILLTDGIQSEEAWFTFKNYVESKIEIKRFLLFCHTEGLKMTIEPEACIKQVFTYDQMARELSRIKAVLDFEVQYE